MSGSAAPSRLDNGHLASILGTRFVSLLVPVAVTMLVVVWSVVHLTPIYIYSTTPPLGIVVDEEDAGDSTGKRILYSVTSALVIVLGVVAVTFGIVLLYKCNMQIILYGWFMFSAASMFSLLAWVWGDLALTYFQISYNYITMGIFLWNFSVVGLVSLFYHAPPAVMQGYLVVASVFLSWSLTSLPEWTTWSFLICIALYDIVAVLWTQGPLHRLIAAAGERNEPIPGFVYDSASEVVRISSASPQPSAGASRTRPDPGARAPPQNHQEWMEVLVAEMRRAPPFKLGLGDFIFYSLLVGRASMSGFVPWTLCFITILAGMVGTLLSLMVLRNKIGALPALPISIFAATVVFVLCKLALAPLSQFASVRLLVL